MSASVSADAALLAEHFTYRPITLIDEVINSINELSFKAINAIEKGLQTADPSNIGFKIPSNSTPEFADSIREKCKQEIEVGAHRFETLFEAKIDTNFDKLEIFALRNMLAIPPEVRDWIRLGHYEGLNLVEQRDEDAPSAETVRALRRKYRETLRLHALLEAEKAKNEATIGSLKRILLGQGKGAKKEPSADVEMEGQLQDSGATFAFLGKSGGLGGEGQPLTTTTSFALSQVPALKSLLENLEPRLSDLTNGEEKGTLGEEEKSWKRTRLEFIEKETQRHLENARGLELGEQGAVRDGEWQGEGRTLGKGEVESLEKVVSIIGGATDGDPMDEGA